MSFLPFDSHRFAASESCQAKWNPGWRERILASFELCMCDNWNDSLHTTTINESNIQHKTRFLHQYNKYPSLFFSAQNSLSVSWHAYQIVLRFGRQNIWESKILFTSSILLLLVVLVLTLAIVIRDMSQMLTTNIQNTYIPTLLWLRNDIWIQYGKYSLSRFFVDLLSSSRSLLCLCCFPC